MQGFFLGYLLLEFSYLLITLIKSCLELAELQLKVISLYFDWNKVQAAESERSWDNHQQSWLNKTLAQFGHFLSFWAREFLKLKIEHRVDEAKFGNGLQVGHLKVRPRLAQGT